MGGQFRYEPPSRAVEMVHRHALVAQLAQRARQRLVTVVAGPGFGKTTALVEALAARPSPDVLDVWLSCVARDDHADHLLHGLREACGLQPRAGLATLCEWVWRQAPTDVCFVLDDVHELSAGSAGAATIAQLLDDLPANGHVVLASRQAVPVPTARLAANHQLVRISENDLLFDDDELRRFAHLRGCPERALASSGGWPALAELATTGGDLVPDYLWEEVLQRLGGHRGDALARFYVAGGGGDDVALAVTAGEWRVQPLVADVPLVERSVDGAVLHPLWGPALRALLEDADVREARRSAAAVHRRAGRLAAAADLALEAEAWDDVLEILREAALRHSTAYGAADFESWLEAMPASLLEEPEAVLALGLARQGTSPLASCAIFERAAAAFATKEDVEGEVAALAHHGMVLWWAHDTAGLLTIMARLETLAAEGSAAARALCRIGQAAVAHILADSPGVLAALAGIDQQTPPEWRGHLHWLRSVAHRRAGDLAQAAAALDALPTIEHDTSSAQIDLARARTAWLAGNVDEARNTFALRAADYAAAADAYLAHETSMEWASKQAWIGDAETAADLLAAIDHDTLTVPDVLPRILGLIAATAIRIEQGDEEGAAAALRSELDTSIAGPDRWYWRDRGALSITYVLVPESRPIWDAEVNGPAHRPGLALARALAAWRSGDPSVICALAWPPPGIVRANLPRRWVIELCAAGCLAGNPPPGELLEVCGDELRDAMLALASRPNAPVSLAGRIDTTVPPSPPSHALTIEVLGPIEVRLDGVVVDHPNLRRARVRQLLSILVVRRRASRDQIAAELWPDHPNPSHNLSVTLNYLQQVLEPGRANTPYYIRADGPWLTLVSTPHIEVDLWQLEDALLEGRRAEDQQNLDEAIEHYRRALPYWRGDPLLDLPDAQWALAVQSSTRIRYTDAAVRAGDLLLARDHRAEAVECADRALAADPTREDAHRIRIRARLAADDRPAALLALAECARALADLGLTPSDSTRSLVAHLSPKLTHHAEAPAVRASADPIIREDAGRRYG